MRFRLADKNRSGQPIFATPLTAEDKDRRGRTLEAVNATGPTTRAVQSNPTYSRHGRHLLWLNGVHKESQGEKGSCDATSSGMIRAVRLDLPLR